MSISCPFLVGWCPMSIVCQAKPSQAKPSQDKPSQAKQDKTRQVLRPSTELEILRDDVVKLKQCHNAIEDFA
jgi:hypothetical protein